MSAELTGACACGAVRYRLASLPMFVHCCHCKWCQRETGSAFVLNALIEADRVELLSGAPVTVDTPSESGSGQRVVRCPECQVALWSFYSSPKIAFVRVGTLDSRAACPPDIHIFTESKQPWVPLPPDALAVPEFYDYAATWPEESYARFRAAKGD